MIINHEYIMYGAYLSHGTLLSSSGYSRRLSAYQVQQLRPDGQSSEGRSRGGCLTVARKMTIYLTERIAYIKSSESACPGSS